MKKISVILSSLFVFMTIASSVVFNACTKDPCKDIICKNNGICRDGSCRCSLGFEGPFCANKMYEKFIGSWDGTYRCNGLFPETETIIVDPEPEPNRIRIYNIFQQNVGITATVNVEKVDIESQTVGNITYRGNGYVEGNYMTLYIEEKDNSNGNFFSCVFNGTKFINP
jgi:hypothetical protein